MTVTAEQIIRRLGLEPLPARQAAVHRDLLLPDRRARLVPCTAQTTDRRDLPLLRGRPGRYAAVVPQGTQLARAPRPRLHAPAPRADRVAARRVAGLSPRPRRPMVLAGRDDGARLHRFGLRWRRAGGDGGALTGGCRGDRAPCTTLTDGDVQARDTSGQRRAKLAPCCSNPGPDRPGDHAGDSREPHRRTSVTHTEVLRGGYGGALGTAWCRVGGVEGQTVGCLERQGGVRTGRRDAANRPRAGAGAPSSA